MAKILKGKVAVVTGGGRGIGRAIAIELAKNGANIVIAARKMNEMKSAAKEIMGFGNEVLIVKTDVTERKDIKNMVQKTLKKFGRLDILVNNAGILYNGPFSEMKPGMIGAIVNVNLIGAMHCTKEALPAIKKNGLIINISSIAGKDGYPDLAVYSATKFGLIGFTESLAGELEGKGIGVYAICPKATQTKMWKQISNEEADHVPEDVAVEVMNLIKRRKKITPGKAINVRKHV